MQPRLTRSTSETMVAGVCGGLAAYFTIDPVIVRMIFVVVTFTSGFGVPVYIVLWIIMPKGNPTQGQQSLEEGVKQFSQEATRLGQEFSQEATRLSREVLVGQRPTQAQPRSGGFASPPRPPEYRFDPLTGQPLGPDSPNTGQTVTMPPVELPAQFGQPAPQRARRWSTLGLILIGIGALVFLEQLGIDMSLIFPVLLIVAGVILMRRKR